MDAYSKRILGRRVAPTLEAKYSIEALKPALETLPDGFAENLIHHSDRGTQYASADYIEVLTGHSITPSMTESGNPKDNAMAERINNTMKNELLKGMRFTSISEVIAAVARAVDFYNNERPHMSIDMMTPAMAAFCEGKSRNVGSATARRQSRRLWKSLKIVYLCPLFRGLLPGYALQSTPERDKTWETTKNRDNDESQPIPVIMLNQSQLLSGKDSF